MADDWLEDDLEEIQPKKKRRLRAEQNGIRGEDVALPSAARGQNRHLNSDTACRGRDLICILFYSTLLCLILPSLCSFSPLCSAVLPSSNRSLSLKKNGSLKPHQVKMTQMPGMVRLGRREVNRSHSPTVTDDDDRPETPPPPQMHMQVWQKLRWSQMLKNARSTILLPLDKDNVPRKWLISSSKESEISHYLFRTTSTAT